MIGVFVRHQHGVRTGQGSRLVPRPGIDDQHAAIMFEAYTGVGVLRDPHGAPTYSPQVRDPAFHNRAVAETGPCGFRTSFVHSEQRAVEIMALEEREATRTRACSFKA
ncbi:hypothetical protein ABZT23_10740 [Streptomyces sp. NPDC005386]|uniref:hypothetical protein n=1 Tax=Streptomyces sp. NPDC005386 TaxID=3154562 RepID=UPI0033B34952